MALSAQLRFLCEAELKVFSKEEIELLLLDFFFHGFLSFAYFLTVQFSERNENVAISTFPCMVSNLSHHSTQLIISSF